MAASQKNGRPGCTAPGHALELFCDLACVGLIADLARALPAHIDASGLASYASLSVIVWWAWLNGTMYHDFHGNNDICSRVFTFLQMFTVASMAVYAHNALGQGSVGFALSYAANQLILTHLRSRTGVHDPDHRPLSQPYALAFRFTTLPFVVSVFAPVLWRFYQWAWPCSPPCCSPWSHPIWASGIP